jgi:hypothetical protein
MNKNARKEKEMLKINKKTITLTRGDNASIRLRPRYDDEERTEYVVEEGDRVIFRMKVKNQLIEKECSISVENNRIVVSFIPQDTIDLSPGVYRYEAELITSWQMHYTFLQDQTFILTKELERRLGTEIGSSNSGNENSTSEIDGELNDDNIIDGDLQPTNPSLDYDVLENKPKLNGKTIQGSKTNEDYGIPTKTSDLENDSDFVSDANYVHTDNNYTSEEQSKLEGIESGAEVNVQSDWEQSDSAADDYIKNKPENLVQDANYVHTDNNYTSDEKNKLSGIEAGAEANVQSDWSEADNSKDDFIKNKPTKVSDFQNDSGFITKDVNDLTNYYKKSETYTQTEINNSLSGKVDKETGKGLSSNDYTDAEKIKLSGIAAGAEVNVQSDWQQSDSTKDDYIKNKPENLVQDASYVHTDNNYTSDEKNKLSGIAAGAEVNVQSDWNQASSSADDYIKNKPENLVQDASYVHTDNNYTTTEKNKLSGIAAGAEVNVQSDWNQANSSADDYIKNKPENLVQDASYVHTDNNYTTTEKNKLAGIAAGAEVNVQSDWNQSNSSADDFIKNKPQNLVQDANYVHTDNNYSNAEKAKFDTKVDKTTFDALGLSVVNGKVCITYNN